MSLKRIVKENEAELDILGDELPQTMSPNVRISKSDSQKLKDTLPQDSASVGGLKRIICLTPLAKIFQPYTNIEPYLENPQDVYKEEPFNVIFESSWATKSYEYGKSYLVTELEALYLVGVANDRYERATGSTGFVYFNIPEDMLAAFEFMQKTGKKIDNDLAVELNRYLGIAKQASHNRIMDHMRDKFNLAISHKQQLTQAGGTPPPPTDMEALIAFILREEVKKSQSKRAKLRAEYEEATRTVLGR